MTSSREAIARSRTSSAAATVREHRARTSGAVAEILSEDVTKGRASFRAPECRTYNLADAVEYASDWASYDFHLGQLVYLSVCPYIRIYKKMSTVRDLLPPRRSST